MDYPFEIGPIRPPSEAHSLLVRVSRNCPWNRCAFCPVYKGTRFSIREVDEVVQDIRNMGLLGEQLTEAARELDPGSDGEISWGLIRQAGASPLFSPGAAQVAVFLAQGGRNVFLQDANSLVMPPAKLLEVLQTLGEVFPTVRRVTSYARAHTITRRKPEDLEKLREAGLNRIHIGLESGSDEVLALVQKGLVAQRHIDAGLRVKAAGMELSEYVMPGLGGRRHTREHATESARVLAAMDPDFIRLRTTAVAPGTELEALVAEGKMEPMDDEEVVEEIRLFLENLECTSRLQSDHTLNLLVELDGQLPEDKPRLLEVIARFQDMEQRLRKAFIIGRRAGGYVNTVADMDNPTLRARALELLDRVQEQYGDDLQGAVRDLMSRFV